MRRLWNPLFAVLLGMAAFAAAGCSEQPSSDTDAAGTTAVPAVENPPARDPGSDDRNTTTTAQDGAKTGMNVEKKNIGTTSDATEVDQYTLTNDRGMKVTIMTFGATITSVEVPDRDGKRENVTLYCDSLDNYLAGDSPYFGCVVGRYANRIAKGKFTLNGTEYTLATNDGANHLHGGTKGFDKQVWKAEPITGDDVVGVTFSLESPDGDEGYPGKLSATVTYTLNNDNTLALSYTAEADKPTVVNLTNHAYWNLAGAGKGDILKHELTLNADHFLPVDDGLIPLGQLQPVKDTPMDFTQPAAIGSRIDQVEGGYDHCYVLNKAEGEELPLAARAVDPGSGRVMEIYTSQPAIQFYTGNFLDGTLQAGGVAYQEHHAFCLETQHYPDSPNQDEFPSTVLRPGQTYEQVTVHKFSVQQ
ncbi:MAG: galactose mutarotase [Pirellulales bacterium]|nr:galactose mutarotase [Pirellulales bacterium]